MKRTLHFLITASLACAGLSALQAFAAADISDSPLINTTVATKPNLLFVLDDSGSMGSDYMPDDASDSATYKYWSYQCNGLQYNPATSYPLPVTSTGASYPNMGFASAWSDGYKPSLSNVTSSSTSLDMGVVTAGTTKTLTVSSASGFAATNTVVVMDSSNSYRWMLGTITTVSGTTMTIKFTFSTDSSLITQNSWSVGKPSGSSLNNKYYYTYSGTEKLLNWTYSGNAVDTGTTFYQECNSAIDTLTSKFTKVIVTTSSSYTQNYANWYSYYRKRYLMARSATGRAIGGLNSNFRVGFTIISDEDSAVAGTNNFVDVLDFTDTQRLSFFNNFYQVEPGGYTPLRTALNKAGKYYANKMTGQTDPMQYSCQRNYTLLTTDGYWNDGTGKLTKLDGTTDIGQQDGTENKPMWDGEYAVITQKDTTVSATTNTSTTTTTKVSTPLTTKTEIKSCTKSGSYYNCTKVVTPGNNRRTVVTQTVSATTVTTTSVHTVVTTNGVVTTDSTTNTPKTTSSGPTTTTQSDITDPWAATGSPTTTAYTGCKNCANPTGITYATSTASTTTSVGPVVTTSSTTPTVTSNTTTTRAGGVKDTLADVAEYYYNTDIRDDTLSNCTSGATGENVCNNEVPTSGRDTQKQQHMTTFTLGFGVNGTLAYDPNYLTQTSGTYVNLINGSTVWPTPSANNPSAVDDLWHAAVNGRGQYFSASNPTVLASSLATVINTISKVAGAGAAAASSSLKPVQGQDQIFVGSYTTLDWTGDLQAQTINLDASKQVYFTDLWSASTALTGRTYTDRVIYYKGTGGATGSGLAPFDYTHLSTDGLAANFTGFCSKSTVPDQCTTLTTTQQTSASGANLVNFLRGDRTNEATATGPLYRTRVSVLGDIVGSGPVYIGKPPFKYADAGYSDFVTNNASRAPMVYVAANDGMLHAFSAASNNGGQEMWAYVPTMVMPNMYRLADTAYSNRHRFILDGTPVSGDIMVGSTWKSILVGGLGAGGSGYYALDITDPANPKSLWEFTDSDMGRSYGNPIITKLANGTWVVVFTSGYNNTGPGYLYVINANTGAQIYKIQTKDSANVVVGTSASPANLGEINAWIDDITDNTAKRIYGGDMLGNLWRFDISSLTAPYLSAMQLAKFQIGSGSPVTYTPQPITTRPELANVKYGSTKYPVILVGTGRYLGATDIPNTLQQSMYAIKDPLTSTGWGDVRTNSNLTSQTVTSTATAVSTTSSTLDWSAKIGWKYDFPLSRERLNTDMVIQYTTLVFSTTVPESTMCTPAGSSWDYNINILNGQVSGEKAGNYMTVGISTIALTINGATQLETLRRKHTGETTAKTGASAPPDAVKRTSWRELID